METLKASCNYKWNFHRFLFVIFFIRKKFFSAFFFAGTVATTIGYGHMVPQSNLGKIASLIFMIVGIPYFALMTTFISANINLMFNKLRNAVREFLFLGVFHI